MTGAASSSEGPLAADPEVLRAAARFTLTGPPPRSAATSGERAGRTAGSGLEFREHRRYLPGDDVRHLDWAAFARTDVPTVRVFREEVARGDAVWLDGSASMGCDAGKSRLARSLAAAILAMAARAGDRATLHVLSEAAVPSPRGEPAEVLDRRPVHRGRVAGGPRRRAGACRRRGKGVRVIVSDFLFPHDPDRLVRSLAAGSAAAKFVQVLSPFEADPPALGGRRLTDPEANEAAEVTLDAPAVAAYRARLRALQDGLAGACRSRGAAFAAVVAGPTLEDICRGSLCPAGVLGVAG